MGLDMKARIAVGREERRRLELKRRARTRPGSLLKHQIPVRTFADWDESKPGFGEVDLVSHDGGRAQGDFLYSLNVTDGATGWPETEAVKNRAQVWVFEALERVQRELPFKLLRIDSDNDRAFINAHLVRYCEQKGVTFTRSLAYKKNNNCYVEQKNYPVIRKLVGYRRYATEQERGFLQELYSLSGLYMNYFQPVMKLVRKERHGSKVRKIYDEPRTPYQRLLNSSAIETKVKRELRKRYAELGLAKIKR